MRVKISIIIPVYNVEQYLRKCLDSCINQTFKNIEIIVVNDCSPDNSDVIMREYEQKYQGLVKCIYLEKNIKQGGARNRGLEVAQGEYIMFVDSDDWIEDDMCEQLYKSASNNNADLVICDWYKVFESRTEIYHTLGKNDESADDIKNDEMLSKIFSQFMNATSWCKLYKKSLIEKLGYKFPEDIFFEDSAVVWIWILTADKINYVKKPLYNYLIRRDSTLNQPKKLENRLQRIKIFMMFIENTIKLDYINKYRKIIWDYIFLHMYSFITEFSMYFIQYQNNELTFLSEWFKKTLPEWKTEIINNSSYTKAEKKLISYFLTDERYLMQLHEINRCRFSSMCDKRIAVWGGRVLGERVIDQLKQYGIIVKLVIDNSKDLQGGFIGGGIPIVSVDYAINKCDIIIAAVRHEDTYKEIKQQAEEAMPGTVLMYYTDFFYK